MRVGLVSQLLFLYSQAGLIRAKSAEIRGLDPRLAEKYVPSSDNMFECLDGSQRIPFARVNDDYCDCTDGSDEPGTSACTNGTFYCANTGHTPGTLSASRVNDGVCDYDVCCDGSDEWNSPIKCPDKCAEIGAKRRDEEEKLAQTNESGARKLQELIASGRELRQTKSAELEHKRTELAKAEQEYSVAEAHKNELEQIQRDHETNNANTMQQLTTEYLEPIVQYRKELAAQLHILRAHRDTLIQLLKAVRDGHNVEFNDEVVAKVVREYGEYAEALPYMEEAAQAYADEDSKSRKERELLMDRDSEEDDASLVLCVGAVDIAENELRTVNDDISVLLGWMRDLQAYNRNYHDLAVKGAVVALADFETAREREMSDVSARHEAANIGELKSKYDEAKPLVEAIAPADESALNSDGEDEGQATEDLEKQVADARSQFWEIQNEKTRLTNEVSNLRELLEEKDLGPHDEFLSLYKQCYSLDTGEYTYEVCLLDRAAQIENKNNARQNLGTFIGFGQNRELNYRNGAKCWNGPERSITVAFECASVVELVEVKEPEKCEYRAVMTGPFACKLPSSGDGEVVDGEVVEEHPVKEHVHDEL
ncbi:hypothetical protein IW148_005198 [Coemansia sp. RSA 1199]|nr:hypothetical protein IW148_005198 [Coemansia sp. RSA 1199]